MLSLRNGTFPAISEDKNVTVISYSEEVRQGARIYRRFSTKGR